MDVVQGQVPPAALTVPTEGGNKITGILADGHLAALRIGSNRCAIPSGNSLTGDGIDHRRKALAVVNSVLAVAAVARGSPVWEASRHVPRRARLVLTEWIRTVREPTDVVGGGLGSRCAPIPPPFTLSSDRFASAEAVSPASIILRFGPSWCDQSHTEAIAATPDNILHVTVIEASPCWM